MALDMPVNANHGSTIACPPFGHQVLIPGLEVARIRSASGGAFSPNVRQTRLEGLVDDLTDGVTQVALGDKAPPGIEQVAVGHPVLAGNDALQAGVGAHAIEAEQ